MTFSRFDAADTREIAERMTTETTNEVEISNRQFVIALVASLAGLATLVYLLL